MALTDIELARGRTGAAAVQIEAANEQHRQELAQGAQPDPGMAEFEADHGSKVRAVALGRRIYAAAPSVEAADALGWALPRAGRPVEGFANGPRGAAAGLARSELPLPRGNGRLSRTAARAWPAVSSGAPWRSTRRSPPTT